MGHGYERKPLIEGRGLVALDDFARATGLDRAIVQALTRDLQLDGVADVTGRVVGLFTDGLPTSEQLRAMGLSPRSDYNPDDLRGTEEDADDEDGPDDGSPTWTMGWPGEAQGEAARQLLIHEALLLALDRRTEVLDVVFGADDAFAALEGVQSLLNIGEEPAAAVLDMQVRRFTARDRQYLVERVAELRALAT